MAKFLIDANLPYYFALWNNTDFIHLKDVSDCLSDSEIWNYAKENNLTIITKDADFSNRIILADPPPKIIHLRIGNLGMNDFHSRISKIWKDIYELSEKNKLVNVYINSIEGIK